MLNTALRYLVLPCLLFVAACTTATSDPTPAEAAQREVAQLATVRDRAQFLETIYNEDQRVRNESSAATQRYGYRSAEEQAATAQMMATDARNRALVAAYLERFPYPSLDTLGDAAAATPWLVIHHSPLEYRQRYLDTLYRAYRNGNIQQGGWTLFLKRTDELQNGDMLIMEGRYKPEDELAELYRRLDLTGYEY